MSTEKGNGGSLPRPVAPPAVDEERLEISVSCEQLADTDTFSKSDPLCVMSWKDEKSGKWWEIGRTEVIKNSLDPSWRAKFIVEYKPHTTQVVSFEVYDWDTRSYKLKKQEFLARLECPLKLIASAKGRPYISCIKEGPSKRGKFFIVAEEMSKVRDDKVVKMQVAARGLDKKDLFGKSDPYFVISKASSGHSHWAVVAKSTVVDNTLDPTWPVMEIPVGTLCNGDYSRQLKFEVFDHDNHGNDDLIGEFTTTLDELKDAVTKNRTFPCVNSKKLSKRKYTDSGKLYLSHFLLLQRRYRKYEIT